MKLTKIALGVSLGLGGLAVNAADVAFFPYIVNSPSVTTIVTVIDSGSASTQRYNASGVVGQISANASFNRLHWRLAYKTDGNVAPANSASCDDLNYYLPSSPHDIQSVDMGAHLSGADDRGVLFNDPSINNNWRLGVGGTLTYAMADRAGAAPSKVLRGFLFVNNADQENGDAGSTVAPLVQGEAMVLEFQSGAAWGYGAVKNYVTSGSASFDFYDETQVDKSDTGVYGFSFMPLAETTSSLLVTPENDSATGVGRLQKGLPGTSPKTMLAANGGNVPGWNILTTEVFMESSAEGGAVGVAFDRDENLVSGSLYPPVTCVGSVNVRDLMSSGAQTVLADGGYGFVRTQYPGPTDAIATVSAAAIYKLEYGSGVLNGQTVNGVFNNAITLYR